METPLWLWSSLLLFTFVHFVRCAPHNCKSLPVSPEDTGQYCEETLNSMTFSLEVSDLDNYLYTQRRKDLVISLKCYVNQYNAIGTGDDGLPIFTAQCRLLVLVSMFIE